MSKLVIVQGAGAAALARAAAVLRDEGLVVYPTETFYGVAALPTAASALARLCELKARQAKAVPLVASSVEAVRRVAALEGAMADLAVHFWPGPLTLALLPSRPLPPLLLGPQGTLGVRVSGHPLARALAEAAGGLITSTSANLAGQPPAARPQALAPELVAGVDLVLDAGDCPGGQPSTVVGWRAGRVVVLRQGALSQSALAETLGYEPEVLRD
jgi:L-threonylcarbamoyladenylate synthase